MKRKLLTYKDGRTAIVEGDIVVIVGKNKPLSEESLDHLSTKIFKKLKPKLPKKLSNK